MFAAATGKMDSAVRLCCQVLVQGTCVVNFHYVHNLASFKVCSLFILAPTLLFSPCSFSLSRRLDVHQAGCHWRTAQPGASAAAV